MFWCLQAFFHYIKYLFIYIYVYYVCFDAYVYTKTEYM